MAEWVYYSFVVVSIVAWIWLVVRIGKTSVPGSVLTFFLALPAFYFLIKYWNDKEHGIGLPFFVNAGINTIFLAILFNTATFKDDFGYSTGNGSRASIKAPERSNPEMERWCREKHDAVYHHVLGTCVEPDPAQKAAEPTAPMDVMAQLEHHFAQHGLEARYSEVDESSPDGRRLAGIPEMKRMVQFEIKAKGIMPTMIMVGECTSLESCNRLAARPNRSNGRVSITSNGNLMFFAFQLGGDAGKIERAKEVFQNFKAV